MIVSRYRVPNINERHRIPMSAIRQVVREIADNFRPEKIILFGSYAYGNPDVGSDVDILVIMNTLLRNREQAFEIARSVEHHFGLELIVRTPDQLEKRIALGDPFLKEVVEKGKILYERTGPRVD